MLAVMSYSIELLLCAALGYAVGHSLFDPQKQTYLKMKSNIPLNVMNNNPCHLEFGDDIGPNVTMIKSRTNSDDSKRIDIDIPTDHETTGLLSRRSGSFL